ncbi:MAG TPA: helix-turn-helix domain-containing protein [Flavobacteriales bacterium]|nr:helix-turn-helix domain-containing protein [Flavobacteriales bacterium]
MEAILMTKEHFNVLMTSMEEIKTQLKSGLKKPAESFIDNQEFISFMKISKRTAQTWRDEGKVSFCQVGNKIYYRLSDVEELLNNHYFKAFKGKGAALNRL